jgi:hypothetical protein
VLVATYPMMTVDFDVICSTTTSTVQQNSMVISGTMFEVRICMICANLWHYIISWHDVKRYFDFDVWWLLLILWWQLILMSFAVLLLVLCSKTVWSSQVLCCSWGFASFVPTHYITLSPDMISHDTLILGCAGCYLCYDHSWFWCHLQYYY